MARRKDVFIQERYGRFDITDPFLALQRDYEAGGGEKEKRPMCTSPLSILEAVMAHCRKMQERMSAQLAAAESRQKKLEMEKAQLQSLEQDHKKLSAQLKDEREKNKHIVTMLVKECKQLAARVVEESQKFDDLSAKLEEETKTTSRLEEELAAERQKVQQMEAQMEKQLSEFDTEREQLRAKLSREETRTGDLKLESENLRKEVEQLRSEKPSKLNVPANLPSKTKCLTSIGVGTDKLNLRTTSCQTDIPLTAEHSIDGLKKSPIPVKASATNYTSGGNPKLGVAGNAVLAKHDRGSPHCNSVATAQTENGSSGGGPPESQHQVNPPAMHSLHSPANSTTLQTGLSPRVQAARFKFQASPTEHEQNGTTTQSPPSRDLSPTNRDNLAAKQQARHTVTQVLSRFTSPQTATLRPVLPHSASEGGPFPGRLGHPQIGLKSPTVARVDRGNPPPIPPKKPGLSQTPSPPHPPIKVVTDGSRSPSTGLGIPSKPVPPLSGSLQGMRLINEEILIKTTSPQVPPKPAVDISGAGVAIPIPALATSQVGAWPSLSQGPHQSACSECPLAIPTSSTAIACSSSINPVSPSSCRPRETDSLLVTASVPSLTCGGPVPLAGRPTLLHQAATQGNVTLLSMLLNEDQLDISHLDEDGNSALYSAAKYGHTDCVMLLLTKGALVDVPVKNGFTPIHIAAANGHFRCIELLITNNADVNHAASGGQTPLHLACANGNYDCIRILLTAGADRTATTADGWTPVHAAVHAGHVNCLKLLMYYEVSGDRRFANESESGSDSSDSSYLETIRSQGEESMLLASLINHDDKEGWTAAHIAASKGFKNCLEVLCSHGGLDVEKRDKCNRTVHDVATDDCKHLLENLYSYKVLLQISQSPNEQICAMDILEDGVTIGVLNVRKHTTWDDLSKSLSQAVTNHFHLLSRGWEEKGSAFNTSAQAPIGLGSNSIFSVQIGDTTWYPGQALALTPQDLLKRCCSQHITVKLKGLQETSLDSLAYASLIPLQMLQNYVRLVEQYRNVIFHGPEGSCQEYLAHQIAHCIKHKQEALGIRCEMVKIEVDASLSKEQLVEYFISCGFLVPVKDLPGTENVVVVLENLERADSLAELLGDLSEPLESRTPGSSVILQNTQETHSAYYFQESSFLIGTLARSCLHGAELLVQQHFRWVQLRWDAEPIHSLLQRYLRRKLVDKLCISSLITVLVLSGFLVPVKDLPGTENVVVVLENLERADSLAELLGDLSEPLESRTPGSSVILQNTQETHSAYYFQESSFLIGTLARSCLHGAELLVQQHFRWVQLRWDAEPIHSLLQRYLRRKLVDKFKGQMPPPPDLVSKALGWICSVWHQLNFCLSRLGTPEALIGPEIFFTCPIVPSHLQSIVKWLSRLWNAVIVLRVEEAILSRVRVKRSLVQVQSSGRKSLNQGQQAVVKAALSILFNKAVLQGCPLPRQEIEEHLSEFQGGSFPLSVITSYKSGNKKSRDSGSWRKASTSPRKKSGHSLSQHWSKQAGQKEGALSKTDLDISFSRINSQTQKSVDGDQPKAAGLDQRLSLCSDDENDLMQELQSMCSSKSEPDISKISQEKEDFLVFPGSPSGQMPSKADNDLTVQPQPQKVGGCLLNNSAPGICSRDKQMSESGPASPKSHLPIPLNTNSQRPRSRSRHSTSSNTRQLEMNNNSPEEIWNQHRDLHENN
ncbi:Cortactin-binding protein 2 [Acipenser ruthenus]|uniref:Cortactin-binding protein 2 n=1 Tax=Acipenser ruthenus TaxID=7906 RepID=A0A444UKH8_ACIRT|nr:Cortactin-binding protein 2 [Acipenser ruthenus]